MSDKIDLNDQTERLKQISKLSDLEKFTLTAYFYSDAENKTKTIQAYTLSRPKQSKSTDENIIYIQASRWLNLDKCQAFIKEIEITSANRLKTTLNGLNEEGGTATRNKEQLEIIINEEITKAQASGDSKALSEAIKNLNMLNQYAKEQTIDEEETTHFFIPLKCRLCPLYKAQKHDIMTKKQTETE